jgi:DNA mismatch repair protein MSH5
VLRDLRRRVLSSAPSIRDASRCVAEVDCLLSLSRAAVAFGLRRPTLTRESRLSVVGGRHLLQEAASGDRRASIPNDAVAPPCPNGGRVTIVTGPTMSGKSVYVKSIAIIAFLAHVGSFVPAESAVVGVVDRIFTRVVSHDSIAQRVGQSSFAHDLSQISLMINNATPRSLCIVDEFGKGTKTADGVGLLGGFLRAVSEIPEPPIVFAATHFSDVTDDAFVPRNANMNYLTMSVYASEAEHEPRGREYDVAGDMDGDASYRPPEITFLYKAVPGVSTRAYSARCAREAGLPRVVLERIEELDAIDRENDANRRDLNDANRRGRGRPPVVEIKPAAMSRASDSARARREACVERLSRVNLDDPGEVAAFVKFCAAGG